MFLLFDRATFHNRTINRIAQSAFAVYLITDYAASEKLLWVRLFNLQDLYQQPLAILQILGILLAIYAACSGGGSRPPGPAGCANACRTSMPTAPTESRLRRGSGRCARG